MSIAKECGVGKQMQCDFSGQYGVPVASEWAVAGPLPKQLEVLGVPGGYQVRSR